MTPSAPFLGSTAVPEVLQELPHPEQALAPASPVGQLLFLPGTCPQSLSLLSLLSLLLLSRSQSAVSVPRDFEGCSTLRKYLGQLHFLQSRIPMGHGQDAAVPVTW